MEFLAGSFLGVVAADLVFWGCKYCCGSLLPGRLVCSASSTTIKCTTGGGDCGCGRVIVVQLGKNVGLITKTT